MLRFPIQTLLNQDECYQFLLDILHPNGLTHPQGHQLPEEQAAHDCKRDPIVKYRCRESGSVFNIFTDTILNGTHYDGCTLVLMIRGFVKGASTQMIADELELDYGTMLQWRHRLQEQAIMPDKEVEAAEMYQNTGEKGEEHDDEDAPTPTVQSAPRPGHL